MMAADIDKAFSGSIPEIYDTYLVPLIFAGYANDIAERTAELLPGAVLETAAGTGAVTRALAARLAADVRLAVTDLNQAMLDRAAKMQRIGKPVEWRQADALNLPFEDNSFDAVVCQFGAMFFPDKVAAYGETRRVLRPGGKFLFNVWDRIETNEFANVVTEAASSVFPHDPPRFLARTPHGYHDVGTIRNQLEQAGFSEVSVATLERTSRAPSARHPAVGFCQGTPLRSEIEQRDSKRLDEVTERAANALAERYGMAEVSGKIQAHMITALR